MARLSGVSTDSLSSSAKRGRRLSAASVIGLGSILRDQKILCGSIYNTMSRSSNVLTTQIITNPISNNPLASPLNNNSMDPTYNNLNNNIEATADDVDPHISNNNLKEEDTMWLNLDMIKSSSDHLKSPLSSTATERIGFLNHNHTGGLGFYNQGRTHHDGGASGFSHHEINGCGNDYINHLHGNGHNCDHVKKHQSRVNNITVEGSTRDGYTSRQYLPEKGSSCSINDTLKNFMSEASSTLTSRQYSDGGGPMPILSTAQKRSAMYDFRHYVEHQSAPVNAPDWSRILKEDTMASKHKKKSIVVEEECDDNDGDVDVDEDENDNDYDEDDDDNGNGNGPGDDNDRFEERIPPHELLARERACSQMITFSVCEGQGRTLKGRDISRVRNAVWKQIGLAD